MQSFAGDVGTVYDGEWVEGMRHGAGRLSFDAAGKAYYDGGWKSDKKSGKGTMVYASGNVYVGDWVGDVKNGRGKMTWITSGESYEGEWVDGRPHGEGEHVWERSGDAEDGAWFNTKNQYKGEFKAGLRHGTGVFLYATGAKYEGHWVDNCKHGEGVYTFEDGSVFKGKFAKDRAVVKDGQPPFGPTKHLRLDVDDLVDEEPQSKTQVTVNLDHLLLRYNSELRGIYRKHAVAAARAAGRLPSNPNKAVPLSIPGFVNLMRLAGLVAPDFTVATMAKSILPAWCKPEEELPPPMEEVLAEEASQVEANAKEAAMRQMGLKPAAKEEEEEREAAKSAEAAEAGARPTTAKSAAEQPDNPAGDADVPNMSKLATADALDPNVCLLYRQFAECLVRAAHVKFHNLPGLDRRVNKLVVEHLLPAESPGALESLPWDDAMASEEVVSSAISDRLKNTFVGLSPGEDIKPPTVTARSFLSLLKRTGALNDGEPEGMPIVEVEATPAKEEGDAGEGEGEGEGDEEKEGGEETKEGEEGDGEEEAAVEEEEEAAPEEEPEPSGPSLSTLEALAAFTAAIGPAVALAEAEAEAEAVEAEAQAAHEAGEEPLSEEAATEAAASRLEAKSTTLLRCLDCEATYPEFVEAVARCADIALIGDTPLHAKIAVFLTERLKL